MYYAQASDCMHVYIIAIISQRYCKKYKKKTG